MNMKAQVLLNDGKGTAKDRVNERYMNSRYTGTIYRHTRPWSLSLANTACRFIVRYTGNDSQTFATRPMYTRMTCPENPLRGAGSIETTSRLLSVAPGATHVQQLPGSMCTPQEADSRRQCKWHGVAVAEVAPGRLQQAGTSGLGQEPLLRTCEASVSVAPHKPIISNDPHVLTSTIASDAAARRVSP